MINFFALLTFGWFWRSFTNFAKPDSRPTFDGIVNELKTNPDFTVNINEYEFYDYVEFIDEYKSTYDARKKILKIGESVNKLYTKLNDIQKFNLIGFTFIEMFTIEKFNDGYLDEKGDEKILVWKFIPSNDNGDDSYIDYMHNLHHKNPFRALGDFKEISFIDVNLKQLKYPEIIYDGNLLYDIIKNPEILAHKYYDPVAQNKIGKYYYYKDFTDSSKIIALEYFKKAANQNNPEAIFYIGQAYLTGILKGNMIHLILDVSISWSI